ncbi:MAG: TIM barrel protein [Armatimonadetes bacterium]|nr:TIM barrel protein [Armatimonadota bacterium]
MTRRELLQVAGLTAMGSTELMTELGQKDRGKKFKHKFAPHFGMFSNHAASDIDQLKFAADEGFHAWEDNGMKGRSVADQEKIAKTMIEVGITMGIFVVNMDTAWSPTLVTGKKDSLDKFLEECKSSVPVAKRVNAKWMTVVPGMVEPNMDMGYQTANVIDALRKACEIFEPHGLVMVLEPLNFRDHPGLFLNKMGQGYEVCRAVNSPSCKILMDMYHQQIHEGNLIPNIDRAYSEIGYFQIGDNPGRNEPTSGEVNYGNVFKHIGKKGYTGILGMEHGKSMGGKEGERKVIDAYRMWDL